MRLDQFLKVSRLVPRRSLAQEFCEKGLVTVNKALAKSSRTVKAGDTITIQNQSSIRTVLVKVVPLKKQLSAAQAAEVVELIASEKVDRPEFLT